MIFVIFLFVVLLMIFISKKLNSNWVNLISILMVPYVLIILINNFFMTHLGFYKISDKVILLYLFSFLVFFSGNLLPYLFYKRKTTIPTDNSFRFSSYDMNLIINILLIIGLLGGLKFIFMLISGSFNAANFESSEGKMGNGIVGHLILISHSLFPIVFLYFLEKRNVKALISMFLIVFITFTTFVKYNILGLFVSTFIFTALYRKSSIKKGLFFLCFFTLIVFVSNYFIGFVIRDMNVKPSFYLNHLWVYCGGSIINANNIFIEGINNGISIFYKLLSFLFAFPNMFLQKFFHVRYFTPKKIPFQNIGLADGQKTNVVDAIGYLFPSQGNIESCILFFIILFFLGSLFSLIVISCKKSSVKFSTFLSFFLTFFVFFSFFGEFYIHSGPWEILFWSSIVPNLLIKLKRKGFSIKFK